MNKIGFVIGNGLSRKNINLKALSKYGLTVGCNALYRDYSPDVLVVMDRKMFAEIRRAEYSGLLVYRSTNEVIDWPNAYRMTINHGQVVNSGLAAFYVALKLNCTQLYLLGFDLFQQNVYAGTLCYSNLPDRDFSPPKRLEPYKRMTKWLQLNPHIQCTRVIEPGLSYDLHEWQELVPTITVEKFNELYR